MGVLQGDILTSIDDPASAEMHCYNIGTMEHLFRAYAVKEGHSPPPFKHFCVF